MKQRQNRLVLLLASLTGGVGLGALIAFFVFPMKNADLNDSPFQEPQSSPQTSHVQQENLAAGKSNLEEVIDIEKPIDRRRALYQLLSNKSGGQVEALLRQALSLDYSKNLYSVQRILLAELTVIDPEKSLGLVWESARTRSETLLNIVAIHWSSSAPEKALRTFSSLDEPWKSKAIETVFQHQGILSDAEIAEIAESLDITDQLITWKYDTQIEAVIEDPRNAFKLALMADTTSSHRTRMLTHITSRWLEREGTENIPSMLSLVYDVFKDARFLWGSVVSEIAASDPEFVWQQLSSMPIEVQRIFASPVFRQWVDLDPITAIQTVTTKEYLDDTEFDFLSLLIPWVRAVADRFLENFELVPTDWKHLAIRIAVEHVSENSPPGQVIQLLTQLKSMGYDAADATATFVKHWSHEDAFAAFEWALKNFDQESFSGRSTAEFALGRLALLNPERAMELALEQPKDMKLEWGVVMTLLRQGQIDKALSLLPNLRGSSDSAVSYTGINLPLIQAGRIDEVLALGDQLNESERHRFYRSMGYSWARFEPESLLERLPKLPTAEMRKSIVQGALWAQETDPVLTEEELEFVTSFVPDETN